MPKRIIIDLDGTLTLDDPTTDYPDKPVNLAVAERLREYRSLGFEIVVHSSRNMRTVEGALGKINVHTLPGVIDWLRKHDIPFDEVIVGKPWCGFEGFYVDDRAVRPDEFARLDHAGLLALIGATSAV